MGRYGFQKMGPTGPHTATAAGCMSLTTAGRGFPTNPGAGPLITTGVGSSMAGIGAGGRVRFTLDIVRSGHPRTSPFSASGVEDGDSTLGSDSEAALEAWAGCHAGPAIAFSPGTDAASTA